MSAPTAAIINQVETARSSNPPNGGAFDLHGYISRTPIYQRYLMAQNQATSSSSSTRNNEEDEEEEPVHALDLRICKVDESISRFNTSNVLSHRQGASQPEEQQVLEPQVHVQQTEAPLQPSPSPPGQNEYQSPMPAAFPGQIPPDRRYTAAPSPGVASNQEEEEEEDPSSIMASWPPTRVQQASMAVAVSMAAAAATNGRPLLGVRPLAELTEQSNACKMVEAATSSWRFSPYERPSSVGPEKSFFKSERMSPGPQATNPEMESMRNTLVMRNRLANAVKSSFLHNVLKHKETQIKREPMLSETNMEVTDPSLNALDRRMEAMDRSFNSYRNQRYSLLDYSPPPSPPTMTSQASVSPRLMGIHESGANPVDHDLAMRHKEFLMRLQYRRGISGHPAPLPPPGSHYSAGSSPHHPGAGGPLPPLTQAHHLSLPGYQYHRQQPQHRFPSHSPPPLEPLSSSAENYDRLKASGRVAPYSASSVIESNKGKRGRPRKHAIKIPLPPLYIFIRNLLHNRHYNPRVVTWVCEVQGIFKVNNTADFAKTWGRMKANRNEEMTYEKMSRAMRYHYGNEKQGRKGHLAMVKEKRLVYRFGELAVNWRSEDVMPIRPCMTHDLCGGSMCLWRKE